MESTLALQLYKEGFSHTQSTPLNAIPIGYATKTNRYSRHNRSYTGTYTEATEWWIPPSLTTIVGALGEHFGCLERKVDGFEWIARPMNRHPDYTIGGNEPDEVLARLWLALRKASVLSQITD